MTERWVLGTLTVLLAILLFWPGASAWLAGFLFSAPGLGSEPANALLAENQTLKAELAVLKNVARELPASRSRLQTALVYSRYPLNFKNELWMNAGEEQGVSAGQAALLPAPATSSKQFILLGKVVKTWPTSALVETLFDPRYQLAVRVGAKGADSLLVGGSVPKLTLLSRTSGIQSGDIVYAVSPGAPYGTAIGQVSAIQSESGQLFEEATLQFSYDLNQLHALWLMSE